MGMELASGNFFGNGKLMEVNMGLLWFTMV